jgi:hypothetical protein
MFRAGVVAAVFAPLISSVVLAGQQTAAVPSARFVGTWVGTQGWAIDNPPPGARQDQPVTVTIETNDRGALTGFVVPFLGGEDGATFTEATVVGDELRATAMVGRPRVGGVRGRGAAPPTATDDGSASAADVPGRRGGAGWKDAIRVAFVFRNSGTALTGTADVRLGDVPWMRFNYDLGKKRSRY